MSVYFVKVGDHIKIGYSANPERRVRRLMASSTRYSPPPGTPLDLASRVTLRVMDGDTGTERALHRALEDFRVGTEWFLDEPEVRDFIAAATPSLTEYPHVARPAGAIEPPTVDMSDEVAALMDRFLGRPVRSTA
jgi:hypothetical protein